MIEQPELVTHTKNVLTLLQLLERDLYKTLTGNKTAARRARVALVELEKMGKVFRKMSVRPCNERSA